MGVKKIVLPVRGDGKGDNVLRHAAVLAHRFSAHIDVTHVRANPEDMIPYGVAVADYLKRQILESARSQADSEEERLKDELTALAVELKLVETSAPVGAEATVSFNEERGRQVDVINHLGRMADIIAVAQPDKERNLGANTLKAAIFASGRPVLMCPDVPPPGHVGAHVAIGWNGSIEASRSVRMSMPLIRAAGKVSILTTGPSGHHRSSAPELLAHLAMHGVQSEIITISDQGIIGERLLETSEEIGADLLIMGAYHDGYARQEFFGGNAQSVIDSARIPVVLAH